MIFVAAETNNETIFLMLSEQDIQTMRNGSTKFIDERQTGGISFKRVVLSLSKTDTEALECIRQAGYRVPQLKNPEPVAGESRCKGCEGLMQTWQLFEGQCIVCWATQCKKLRVASN